MAAANSRLQRVRLAERANHRPIGLRAKSACLGSATAATGHVSAGIRGISHPTTRNTCARRFFSAPSRALVRRTLGRSGPGSWWTRRDALADVVSAESRLKMHTCSSCGASMSPWEAEMCLACKLRNPRWLSNADAAVFVLEKEQHPVTTYDVVRGIRREFGWNIPKASLTVSLSTDRRCCWAGRSLYGLYRHGLFPGPRALSSVARLFLYSHAEPMRTELVAFAMQYAGYRFQQASLNNALRYNPNVTWESWHGWIVKPRKEARAKLRQLGVAPTFRGVDRMAERCGAVIEEAISEYRRRLTGRHE